MANALSPQESEILDVPLRRHYPLNAIRPGQQDWAEVVNSPLSEAATLGFEYGFSLGSQVTSNAS